VDALMEQVLAEVADPLAEGYFETLIDYLETNIEDEVFVDFRLNGEELLMEVQTQGKNVLQTEPLKQLLIDYDESFERVATEFLESFI
jgi:frataxin-like iron-binding protein CyaY